MSWQFGRTLWLSLLNSDRIYTSYFQVFVRTRVGWNLDLQHTKRAIYKLIKVPKWLEVEKKRTDFMKTNETLIAFISSFTYYIWSCLAIKSYDLSFDSKVNILHLDKMIYHLMTDVIFTICITDKIFSCSCRVSLF